MEIVQTKNESNGQPRRKGSAVVERDLSKVPEELLSILLHDLRSPLGAIGVLADILSTASALENPPDPRQVAMLQEAVTKAQRIMDDAVEIQSVMRGSSVFTPCVIEMETIVRNSLEKASHAPYFHNVNVEYDSVNGRELIRVDVEKAESALLCAMEHSVRRAERPLNLKLYHSIDESFGSIHVVNEDYKSVNEPVLPGVPLIFTDMNGRLGTRRLGESRFNLILADKVMELMGGRLEHDMTEKSRRINLMFPVE